MKNTFKIGSKTIGEGSPCYILAEAGINHNGDIKLAKKLVDAAVEARADAVKFQTFKAELLVTQDAEQAEYQKETSKDCSQFAMLKKLELKEEDYAELKKYCDEKGIEFLSTPHSDIWSVDVLEDLDINAYKLGSGDLTNIPIIEYIAKLNKPIILSTGMAILEEVKEAIQAIESAGNKDIIALQCTTMYPCPNNKANVAMMKSLDRETKCVIGYSDHTESIEAPVLSACLGARVIEKHFTLDKTMEGPDHKASANPAELKKMIECVRYAAKNKLSPEEAFNKFGMDKDLIPVLLGKEEKTPEPEELEIAKIARKSIVALRDIEEGEKFTEENIGVRRPGEGTPPKFFKKFMDNTSMRHIKKDEYVKLNDIK